MVATYSKSTTSLTYSPTRDGVLSTDLVRTGKTSFNNCTSSVPPNSGSALGGLTDGDVSTTDNSKSTFWNGNVWPVTLTFTLNTVAGTGGSATGYNISEIETIGGWTSTSAFMDQHYTVYVQLLGSSSWVQVGSAISDPSVTNTTCSTRTVLSSTTGTIASNVQAVRLVFTAPLKGDANALVLQEVAICGGAAPDAFRGVLKSVTTSNTVSVSTKVNSLSYTSDAQAGVVYRDSTYPEAVSAGVFVKANGNIVVNGRTTAGGAATTYWTVTGVTLPIWLQMNRSDSTFAAYYSHDGTNWTGLIRFTIPMTNNTLVGLAVNSNAGGALNTAVFSNVIWP